MQVVVGDSKRVFEMSFVSSEILTDDAQEWDAICDAVERALAAAGEAAAAGHLAEVRIKVTPQRAQ